MLGQACKKIGSGYAVLKCRGTGSGVFGGTEHNGKAKRQYCAKDGKDNIEMQPCHLDWKELTLMWYGKMLQTKESRCWTVDMDDSTRVKSINNCNNDDGNWDSRHADDTYFYFDGEQIKNAASKASNTRWSTHHVSAEGCLQCGNDPAGDPTNGAV